MHQGNYPSLKTSKFLNSIPELISKTFPIPGRFRSALPADIAELSRLLTNNRGERALSYLGQKNYLSAYLYYFLPWNLFRLCFLLPSLDLKLSAGNTITDLGSGPLTFVSALWIARPDLRSLPLEFNCVDRTLSVMEAGKKLFNAISNETGIDSKWKINLIKKEIKIDKKTKTERHSSGKGEKKSVSLVCAVNLFNEMYDRIPHNNINKLKEMAETAAFYMHEEAAAEALILTVEPGIPQSGRFISFLRNAFIELGRLPASPCTHIDDCPLLPRHQKAGVKQRWCHFAFDAAGVPKDLKRLSAAAKLPKERLVMSFLLAGAKNPPITKDVFNGSIRIISDAFPLPNQRFGRYGCSAQGLILLTGNKNQIDKLASLSYIEQNNFNLPVTSNKSERDEKSGALIMELK